MNSKDSSLLRASFHLSSIQSVVVEVRNITNPAGSKAVLPCHNQRMIWIHDRLKDRQRVVHWDVFRNPPDHSVERVLDMFPGGKERVYNAYNKGRVTISKTAFSDGNFSLVIDNVGMSDKGVYTCNLHHHYCKIHESIQFQLNVTKSPRKEKRIWDGEKTLLVVLLGSSVMLPCVNRRPLWTEGRREEGQQQVVHWDWQPPGVRHDRADRLVDLYASGERRQSGPLFLRRKMNISADAFSVGDFSLTISDLQPADRGLYSCHLHHHYCGLHERRLFRLIVGPPLPSLPPIITAAPPVPPIDDDPSTNMVEGPRVFNVILPEHRNHFLHQLGYILAIFLLLTLLVLGVILITRRCRRKGLEYDVRRSERGQRTAIELEATELKNCNQEDHRRNYKNNIVKAEMSNVPSPKDIDLNNEMERMSWK